MQHKAAAQAASRDSVSDAPDASQVPRRNRERRISEIVLAAREVFLEVGYAGFATRRVASRVGLTLGNLQYYFPTKEELLRVALESFLRESLGGYKEIAASQAGTPLRRCAALIDRIFRDIDDPKVAKCLFELWAFAQHESYVAEFVNQAYAEYREIFARLLSEINPALTEEECVVRAFTLTAQVEGMMIFAYHGGDSVNDRAEVARATKRSVRLIAGLAAGKLDSTGSSSRSDGSESQSELLLRKTDGVRGLPRVGVFGEDGQILNAELRLSDRQSEHRLLLYRPTMQDKRRELKISQILSAAAKVLASEGYANFTHVRVAKEVGILPSGLQHYFPTHEDLLSATISALLMTYQERYAEMGRPSEKAANERLLEIVEDAFEESCDPRACRFSFEIFALAQHSPIAYDLISMIYSAYRRVFVDLVREIDPTASARQCLARATLIVAQTEGLMPLFTYRSRKDLPKIDKVLEFMKFMSIRIAESGGRPA
ncbi:transcriptional regulator, TetR family [Burkholderia sp. OK233]|nr:transcriptional regulator, TetR family [Burkholderia sp. OK233]